MQDQALPRFTIELKDGRKISGELYPEQAPQTVANFVQLAKAGFFDGLTFHRVIPGFMIQGGCPLGTGRGGPGYSIRGEFARNGIDNPLRHVPGVLSMARSERMDSAGSQFFIMTGTHPRLDSLYAAFGRVLEGMEAVQSIASVPRDASDKPLEPQAIGRLSVAFEGQLPPFEKLREE